ncbi:MAG: winged helix-turn-helix domain-containing protein [Caulobacteraceae bacterium]
MIRRVELAHEPAFALGASRIVPAACEIEAGGARVRLQPRVMQVLVALARAEGAIVSRDDLIADCWRGLSVGEDSINRCIQRLRRLSEAEAAGAYEIETLPRLGYRLIRSGADPRDTADAGPPRSDAGRPSIAVLPFVNLSPDVARDYFVDGLVEEIVTCLTRIRTLFVIASGSSLSLKGQELTPGEAAKKLGVRYVVEGSIRRSGDNIRVAAKLIDVEAGAQIWAERFDDTLDDVFALQDRIAQAVAGVIEFSVQDAETARQVHRPTSDLRSYDLYLRALTHLRTYQREEMFKALELIEGALEHDPDYALALSLAAAAHALILQFRWSNDPGLHQAALADLTARSLRKGSSDPQVLGTAAMTYYTIGELAAALRLADRGVELNPGSSFPLLAQGEIRSAMGDFENAERSLALSMKLDPLSPNRNIQLQTLAAIRFGQGRYAEAADISRELVRISPYPTGLCLLAASSGQVGALAEGRAASESMAGASPNSEEEIAAILFAKPEHRALVLEGLQKLRPESIRPRR